MAIGLLVGCAAVLLLSVLAARSPECESKLKPHGHGSAYNRRKSRSSLEMAGLPQTRETPIKTTIISRVMSVEGQHIITEQGMETICEQAEEA